MNVAMKIAVVATLLLATVSAPSAGYAQDDFSTTGDASVDVESIPISLTQIEALSFGTIMPYGRPGTVTIVPGPNATTAADVFVKTPGTRASWETSGVPNAFYSLDILDTDFQVVNANGDSMLIDSITIADFDASTNNVQDGVGRDVWFLGATLHVNANQPLGHYSGTYNLTVAYN